MTDVELLEAAHEEAWRLAIAGQTPRSKVLFTHPQEEPGYDECSHTNPPAAEAWAAAEMVHFLDRLARGHSR